MSRASVNVVSLQLLGSFQVYSPLPIYNDCFSLTLSSFLATEIHKITIISILIKARLALSQANIIYVYLFACFSPYSPHIVPTRGLTLLISLRPSCV